VLELGEDLLDGVQVWRVSRKEEELGADSADELAHSFAFMTAVKRFLRPETQRPFGGPNNCCAVSETKSEHRSPPIRGYSRALRKSPQTSGKKSPRIRERLTKIQAKSEHPRNFSAFSFFGRT